MKQYTVHAAKSQLSKLLAEAEAGEEVVIARGDKPVVKIVPIQTSKKPRMPGSMKGKIHVDDAFFDPLPAEELALWNGEGD